MARFERVIARVWYFLTVMMLVGLFIGWLWVSFTGSVAVLQDAVTVMTAWFLFSIPAGAILLRDVPYDQVRSSPVRRRHRVYDMSQLDRR